MASPSKRHISNRSTIHDAEIGELESRCMPCGENFGAETAWSSVPVLSILTTFPAYVGPSSWNSLISALTHAEHLLKAENKSTWNSSQTARGKAPYQSQFGLSNFNAYRRNEVAGCSASCKAWQCTKLAAATQKENPITCMFILEEKYTL
jgi:hypothetical protein